MAGQFIERPYPPVYPQPRGPDVGGAFGTHKYTLAVVDRVGRLNVVSVLSGRIVWDERRFGRSAATWNRGRLPRMLAGLGDNPATYLQHFGVAFGTLVQVFLRPRWIPVLRSVSHGDRR